MPPSNREMLRAGTGGRPVKVDRAAGALRGYVVAQLGVFKDDRGEFNAEALAMIERMGNESKLGLKSRLNHASMCEDGVGNYLGRSKDFFLSSATRPDGTSVPAVRADLIFDQTALDTPPNGGGKPLGAYVMDLAESDPEAISSSLVLSVRREFKLNADGTRQKDAATGEDLPPLWFPEKLYGSDIVDTGAAVDGLLSVDGLRDEPLRRGVAMLDEMFPDLSREQLGERLTGFVTRYLNHRFGEVEPAAVNAVAEAAELELRKRRNRNVASRLKQTV